LAALPIASVEAPDATSLVIKLSQPDPSLLVNLATLWGVMVEPSLLDAPRLETLPLGGPGPYELNEERTDSSTQYVLELRDDEYWDADRWTYDEIILRVMPDQTARINALRADEIDGTAI